LGQIEAARQNYEQALAIRRAINDSLGAAVDLNNLGNLFKNQGKPLLARQHLEQAFILFETVGSPHANISRRLLAELDEEEG